MSISSFHALSLTISWAMLLTYSRCNFSTTSSSLSLLPRAFWTLYSWHFSLYVKHSLHATSFDKKFPIILPPLFEYCYIPKWSPLFIPLCWDLRVFRIQCQLFAYKSSLGSVCEIVQDSLPRILYNAIQFKHISRLNVVRCTFLRIRFLLTQLQQIVIEAVSRRDFFWLIRLHS